MAFAAVAIRAGESMIFVTLWQRHSGEKKLDNFGEHLLKALAVLSAAKTLDIALESRSAASRPQRDPPSARQRNGTP
jgi:hypothetical protein